MSDQTGADLDATSLCEAFQNTAQRFPDRVALRTPGSTVEITWRQYRDRVERLAAALASLGVGRGDTVAMMMTNRPEFHLIDSAALHLGATPFSIYNTSAPEQIEYLFGNAANRVVFCERQFADRIQAIRSGTRVEHVVCVDGAAPETTPLDELEQGAPSGFDFEAAWRAVDGGDVATLIYTSGTTGPPKGVELTHESLLAELRALQELFPAGADDRVISFLPSAHIADRAISHYIGMTHGLEVTSLADIKQLASTLPEVKPTIFGAVPRIWEKLMAGLQSAGVTDPSALPDADRQTLLGHIGLSEVRASMCGAAPIPAETLEFFLGLGLPVQEVWGMSELSCVATINPRDAIKVGTVGVPLPGVEVKLADDGELLCRGPIVMRGYRNQPEKTAETIDPDGWLHTGDVAEIDSEGYVKIVDRKKELIINAAGKNMSPANIEQKLKAASPLIGQAIAIGDNRPYNVALIVLDPDAARAFATKNGLDCSSTAEIAEHETAQSAIAEAVANANQRMARVEQIKRYKILATEWEPGGDELTPTSKLKRKPIAAKYAAEIEALYV